MTLSKVTIVGERRHADVVLPADEPVGRLLPDVLTLLDDTVADPPRQRRLATPDGELLGGDDTLASAGIADGAVLRLVRQGEIPAAPVIHDVTEEAGADLDRRMGRWNEGARRWAATLVACAGIALVGVLLERLFAAGIPVMVLIVIAAVLVSAGVVAPAEQEALGTSMILSGGAAGFLATFYVADLYAWDAWLRFGALAAVVALWIVLLGLTSPLGSGGVLGGLLGFVLVVAWMVAVVAAVPLVRVAALLAVVTVILLGMLPRLAMTTSGLAGLDDRRTAGRPVAQREVTDALAVAHRGLVIATIAVAASAAAAGIVLASDPGWWTGSLALLTALVLVSRARIFPLTLSAVSLQAAAVVIVGALLLAWAEHTAQPYGPPAAAAGLVVAALAALAADPAEHVRVRLRRLMDRLEAVAIIAIIPVAIGTYGTYERLLGIFG